MTEKEYWKAFGEMGPRRRNEVVRAVNAGMTKEQAGYKPDTVEALYYDSMIRQKEETEKEYGYTPTFELEELDWDDPVMDIYRD